MKISPASGVPARAISPARPGSCRARKSASSCTATCCGRPRTATRPSSSPPASTCASARGVPGARQLPARPRHGRGAARRVRDARDRPRRRRGAREGLRLRRRRWSRACDCPTASRRSPTRRARPGGSTSSPASSPTAATRSTASRGGYSGPLYAEISPRTFTVLVRQGIAPEPDPLPPRQRPARRRLHAPLQRPRAALSCMPDAARRRRARRSPTASSCGRPRRHRRGAARRLPGAAPHRPHRRRPGRPLRGRRVLGAGARAGATAG